LGTDRAATKGDANDAGEWKATRSDHTRPPSEWRTRIAALRNAPMLLRLTWDAAPGLVFGALLCRVLSALAPLGILAIGRLIIDDLVQVLERGTAVPDRFWSLVALEFAIAATTGVLARIVVFCDVLLAERFTLHVGRLIAWHAASVDLTSYEDPVFYDKLDRARQQSTDRFGMVQTVANLIQATIGVVALGIGVALLSPWALLLLLACSVPSFIGESHYAFLGFSLRFAQVPIRRQLYYLRMIGASRETAKELKLFALAPFILNQHDDLSEELYQQDYLLQRRRLLATAALSLLGTLGYYGAYVLVLINALRGGQSVGSITFLAGAILATNRSVQDLFSYFARIADESLYTSVLREFLDWRPSLQSRPGAGLLPSPIREGFEIRDLWFRFPGSERDVLRGVSFRIRPGERIAIVGANGEGKTTLIKLLTRLYAPTRGQILLDGRDLAEYQVEDLHRNIGVIFQDFCHYEMNVAQNIAIGQTNKVDDETALRAAAEQSLAAPMIERLPHKYRQMLGRRFEGGVELSGGEWQKLGLARAYLRDAKLLVLDEPTAALDARAERDVFEQFMKLTSGKMAIFISHRFSTVRIADRILVISGGVVSEEGSHAELIARGGQYAELFELQAASYR
jgi:ATP-binding cassette subfamily B protein